MRWFWIKGGFGQKLANQQHLVEFLPLFRSILLVMHKKSSEPVEVGSLSHYSQGIFFSIPQVVQDFFHRQCAQDGPRAKLVINGVICGAPINCRNAMG